MFSFPEASAQVEGMAQEMAEKLAKEMTKKLMQDRDKLDEMERAVRQLERAGRNVAPYVPEEPERGILERIVRRPEDARAVVRDDSIVVFVRDTDRAHSKPHAHESPERARQLNVFLTEDCGAAIPFICNPCMLFMCDTSIKLFFFSMASGRVTTTQSGDGIPVTVYFM